MAKRPQQTARRKAAKSSAKSSSAKRRDLPSSPQQKPKFSFSPSPFPIVGIGASAGGLEAVASILHSLPAGIEVAIVLVQHLDPAHKSILPELLSRATPLTVVQVQDGMRVEKNHVYVVPPNMQMTITGQTLNLTSRSEHQGLYMPIDHFFRSLAQHHGSRAIGIILSGGGSDGALGLVDIKDRGGITFVQDERTAKVTGMPHSAIMQGSIDFILSPEDIAKELLRIARDPYIVSLPPTPLPELEEPTAEVLPSGGDGLADVLRALRAATGVDFAVYKPNTILRRIRRRMALRKLDRIDDYAQYLRKHAEELTELYHDLLIKVTGFFRDQEVFDALKRVVFPQLIDSDRSVEKPIRIWVPGCASGEEVYSIAICLLEWLGDRANMIPIQIFATDIDEIALQKARSGVYIENIALDVSSERLRRFFTKVDHNYRISKSIREMCTFAKHNLHKDPPFSSLDLISCRNVLIYFEASLQKRVIPLFHYALNPIGFLMLGTSETIGTFSDLFSVEDKKHKIYAKRPSGIRPPVELLPSRNYGLIEETSRTSGGQPIAEPLWKDIDAPREADRVLLNQYVPAGVLINDQMEILQYRGDTSRYLMPAPGKPSHNFLKMVREGLLVDVRAALAEAKQTKAAVRRSGARVQYEDKSLTVAIHVIPLKVPAPAGSHVVVLFEESDTPSHRAAARHSRQDTAAQREAAQRQESHLQQELEATKQYLQSMIEERDAANEELKSANEEILSSNEELQSTNEELETAKEELQSTNEELTTVNEELQHRNQELAQANNDLSNLFASGHLSVMLLGNDLRIRRFTSMAEKVLKIIPTDIGRAVGDLNLNITIPHLESLILEVLETFKPYEQEVQDREGHWYVMQIRPYLTEEKKIDGAVLLFIDIDSLKDVDRLTRLLAERQRAEQELGRSEERFRLIVESATDYAIFAMDLEGRVTSWNTGAAQILGYQETEIIGRSAEAIFVPEDIAHKQLKLEMEKTLKHGRAEDERWHLRKSGERFWGSGLMMPLHDEAKQVCGFLKIMQDHTPRKRSEEQLRISLREKEVLLKEIHHRVKNNLQLISSLLSLQSDAVTNQNARQIFEESKNRIRSMALVHEKLYGTETLSQVEMGPYIRSLIDSLRHASVVSPAIEVRIEVQQISFGVDTAIPCGLILNELVSNAFKHAFPNQQAGQVVIRLSRSNGQYELVVQDHGVGLPPAFDITKTDSLGLRLVDTLVQQLQGTMQINRNSGTAFTIQFPLSEPHVERHAAP